MQPFGSARQVAASTAANVRSCYSSMQTATFQQPILDFAALQWARLPIRQIDANYLKLRLYFCRARPEYCLVHSSKSIFQELRY
jgi:hypothetical protein